MAVAPPSDSVFRPDEDQQERRAPETPVRGRLPGAFPDDFPLPEASTVFDFGQGGRARGHGGVGIAGAPGDEGVSDEEVSDDEVSDEVEATLEYVSLRLPLGAPAAREWLLREAQAAGWRAELGETMTFRRGDEWIRVAIEPGTNSRVSAARLEYPKP